VFVFGESDDEWNPSHKLFNICNKICTFGIVRSISTYRFLMWSHDEKFSIKGQKYNVVFVLFSYYSIILSSDLI